MNASTRNVAFAVVLGLNLLAGAVLLANSSQYRVNFDSLLAIWSDFARDADKVGLAFTRLSTAEEVQVGDAIARAYYARDTEVGTPLARYVSQVGEKVAAGALRHDMPYRFHVYESPQINAFAIPGGHVFVTTGMLRYINTEGELASVLGHEVSHIDLRHAVERVQMQIRLQRVIGDLSGLIELAHGLVTVAYSQQEENEADRNGMLLMANAGYSPVESIGLFVRMEQRLSRPVPITETGGGPETEVLSGLGKLLKDYFKTHPDWTDRVSELGKVLHQNERAWSGKAFCVGEWNYAALIPCFETQHPEEMVEVSPQSADYQLKLAILTAAAGQAGAAAKHFKAALKAAPDLPQTVARQGIGHRDAGDQTAALGEFSIALKLELLQLSDQSLWPPGATRQSLRSALWQTYADQVSLVTALGRHDYFALPPTELDYATADTASLCRIALDAAGNGWIAEPQLRDAVTAVADRHLTIEECRAAAGLPPP